jgi:hypothetical protein
MLRSFLLTLCALSLSPLALSQQPAAPELFLAAPDDALASVDPDPTFFEQRLIAVRSELFAAAAPIDAGHALALVLELEPGLLETARFEQRASLASGALAFSGSLVGARQSQVCVVLRDGIATGTVRDGVRLYKLNYAGLGWHRIARVDESRFPPCATGAAQVVHDLADAPPISPGVYLTNPNPTIDVLVVYTPLARPNAGGTVAIESLIDLAVLETNQAYINSQVAQRLRLVHQEELVGYSENGNFSTELNRLKNPSDGQIDHVHALRNQYGADEVGMIINGNQACGIGYLMTNLSPNFESSAFTVTSKQCATGYYSFAHELGHNMGSHHDHANASGALYSYSYGHRTHSGANRTILAYAPGTRIQYFSNPNVSYQGELLGVPEGQNGEAENWKSLNNTATTVAQFRCAIPAPYGTGKLTSIGSTPSLSWSNTPSANANNFRVLVSGALPNKVGLVFRGTQPNSAPFLGGTLWVGGAITRLPAQFNDAGGAADFAFPLASISPGDVVYAQHWGRDPQHPDGFGASLSNALRIDVCP